MPAVAAAADVNLIPRSHASRRDTAEMATTCSCGQRRPLGVLLGLRSGGRPRVEGRWFCRQSCLHSDLLERAKRDFPDRDLPPSRVRHRVPLGLLLQVRGVVSAEDLQRALRVQQLSGLRLGDILASRFGVVPQRITEAVAAQWGLPVLHGHAPRPGLMRLAPRRLFHAAACMPVQCTDSRLLVACAEVPDPGLALALERMHPHLHVDFGVVEPADLDSWRDEASPGTVPLQQVPCADRDDAATQAAALLHRLQPVDSRLVRVGRMWWLRLWLEESARAQAGSEMDSVPGDTLDVLFSVPSQISLTAA